MSICNNCKRSFSCNCQQVKAKDGSMACKACIVDYNAALVGNKKAVNTSVPAQNVTATTRLGSL